MAEHIPLFENFPPVSKQQWIEKIIRDLKGQDYQKKLVYTTPDGITVHPCYTREDKPSLRQPLFTHTHWEIMEHLVVEDPQITHKAILHALQNGATGISLEIQNELNLSELLKDVELPYIQTIFHVQGQSAWFIQQLNQLIQQRGYDKKSLQIAVNLDYIHRVLQTGKWEQSEKEDANQWKQAQSLLGDLQSVYIQGSLYHEAGASPACELGALIAHIHTYLSLVAEDDPQLQTLSRLCVEIAVGQDYFMEIAKLRALRKLYALLIEEWGIEIPLHVHGVTAARNLTVLDSYNNLLRTSTAAMAAVCGGCNSLVVMPFDQPLKKPDAFSLRMARNIQLILRDESYMDKIADPAAGSYYIESLTMELAEKAWKNFQEIEKQGGLIAVVQQGSLQEEIVKTAKAAEKAFKEGKIILVGTNKFPNPAEKPELMRKTTTHDFADKDLQPLIPVRLAESIENERISIS